MQVKKLIIHSCVHYPNLCCHLYDMYQGMDKLDNNVILDEGKIYLYIRWNHVLCVLISCKERFYSDLKLYPRKSFHPLEGFLMYKVL